LANKISLCRNKVSRKLQNNANHPRINFTVAVKISIFNFFPFKFSDRSPEVEVIVETEQPVALLPDFCPPATARGIHWNATRAGDVAIVPCPDGATGLARWTCLEEGRWSAASAHAPAHPDLSNCKSAAMTNLEDRVREEDPEDVVVSTLAHLVTIFKNCHPCLNSHDPKLKSPQV
jgi:hypothetical protein